jgi:hypothetical protein
LELILTLCDGAQPRPCAFQSSPDQWTRLRTGLQCNHRGK